MRATMTVLAAWIRLMVVQMTAMRERMARIRSRRPSGQFWFWSEDVRLKKVGQKKTY